MHIVDGIVSAPVLIPATALAAAGVVYGMSRVEAEDVPKVALLAATFFVAGLIRVPIGPASVHLMLPGLLGLLLGPAIFPAMLAGLLLQALLFGFGGVTTLGLNLFNMALPGFAVFYLFSGLLQKTSGRKFALLSGLAGALAAFGAGLLVAGSLALSNGGFLLAAKLILLSNLPVMVVEAFVTIAALSFFAKVKPELLAAFQRPVLRATS